ncbi:DoxX family protein [Halovivax sp.]|uniref:DoxX family protein n=1 Tax=Halovivax sp. TaxID=1935978 RepID=UPI0025BD085A|nr:DoxX family protein [Halovivax sp.]
MTDTTTSNSGPPSALGRLLYSGVFAITAIDGFRNNEKRVEIARESGVPTPEAMVPFATGMLLVANLGILLWKYPRASAGALVAFFLSTTPAIHDFWAMEGKERQANEIDFQKNVALLGAALVLLDEAATDDDQS